MYQQLEDAEPQHPNTGMPVLLMKVIERAAKDAHNINMKGVAEDDRPQVMQEAKDWLASRDTTSPDQAGYLNYAWICEQLDIDPDYLARKLKERIGDATQEE